MTPNQVAQQLRQELQINERIADLLKAHAKNYADTMYRRTSATTEHANLIRLTGVAAGVESFVDSLFSTEKGNKHVP